MELLLDLSFLVELELDLLEHLVNGVEERAILCVDHVSSRLADPAHELVELLSELLGVLLRRLVERRQQVVESPLNDVFWVLREARSDLNR